MDLPGVDTLLAPTDRSQLPEWRPGDAWLAGGSWLFSEPQPSVRRLIDLHSLGWPPVVVHDDGLEIAATCTLAELDAATLPASWIAAPLIHQCCQALLGSFKVWNVATVGGNLCLALPAGAMTSLCAALDGTVLVWTPSGTSRTLSVPEFVTGDRTTELRPGELMRSVFLPAEALRTPTAMRQFSLHTHGRSAALLIGRRAPDALRLMISASVTRPLVLTFPTVPTDVALSGAVEDVVAGRWHDDVHGDPAWRRHLTHRLARQIRDELA